MAAPESPSVREASGVVVVARGRITSSEVDRLSSAIGSLLAVRGITGAARIRVTAGSCDRGPVVVQVNLRVGDTPARVQAVMPGRDDALTAVARLDDQIGRLSEPRRPRPWPDRTRLPLTGAGDCAITRRKEYALLRGTPRQAVFVMDAMDFDVHLFTDAETGEDAVVYRAGPSGLRLARQSRMCPPGSSLAPPAQRMSIVVNPYPTPTLTETAAAERVHQNCDPFLFFTDPATGRGRLLYLRYDGDLGLISPICDASQDNA